MDTKNMMVFVIVVFVADMLWQLYQNKKRNDMFKQLSALLAAGDYESFDELISAMKVLKLFPPFNIAFLKLNEAMMKGDRSAIDRAFDSFNVPMNKTQKEALYKRAFYYYLEVKEKQKANAYYHLLKDLKVRDEETLDIMYDTYVLDGYAYLENVEKQIEGLEEKQQMPYLSVLADMYRNKGESEKAESLETRINDFTEKLKAKEE